MGQKQYDMKCIHLAKLPKFYFCCLLFLISRGLDFTVSSLAVILICPVVTLKGTEEHNQVCLVPKKPRTLLRDLQKI